MVNMSNVIGSSRESNPYRRICNLRMIPLDHVALIIAYYGFALPGMTNRPDLIDDALLRPGRLEVKKEIGKFVSHVGVKVAHIGLSVILMKKLVVMKKAIEINLHNTRGITPKRVISGGVHLRSLAPGQHSSEETSLRCRTVDRTVSNLTGPGI